MQSSLKIALAIATAGRRDVLSQVLGLISRQSRHPDRVVICPASPDDADLNFISSLPFHVEVTHAPKGLTSQRNAILKTLNDVDVVLFIDDDFVMAQEYIANCLSVFESNADVVMVTGRVLADGISGPGLSLGDALGILSQDRANSQISGESLSPVYNGYGCNMALRMAPIRQHNLAFDELLPFYGWLEDLDFTRQVGQHGRQVLSESCRGVHLGVKGGRTSGLRFGYSQIANPVYLWRKGTMGGFVALNQIGRNVLANLIRAPSPESWVDRHGRVKGNLIAAADLVRGRLSPIRVRELG